MWFFSNSEIDAAKSAEDLYLWDSKGNKDIKTYGGMYRGDVPSFRSRASSALGLSPHQRLVWKPDQNEYIVVDDQSNLSVTRYFHPEFTRLFRDSSSSSRKRRRLAANEGVHFVIDLSVPAVERRIEKIKRSYEDKKRSDQKRSSIPPPPPPPSDSASNKPAPPPVEDLFADLFAKGTLFVPLETPWDVAEEGNEGEIQPGSELNKMQRLEQRLLERTKRFNQDLREDPHNVDLWMQFIDFQLEYDLLNAPSSSSHSTDAMSTRTRDTASRSVLEKQVSIFLDALDKNPDSDALLLGYLDCQTYLSDAPNVIKLWNKALDSKPFRMSLWSQYIRFRLHSFSNFSIDVAREVFSKAIRHAVTTAKRLRRNHTTMRQAEETEQNALDLFCQLAWMEWQSGYPERSVAYFQAAIELNFFCPPEFTKHSQKLICLRAFWESEEPRFGEDGSCGWDTWFSQLSSTLPNTSYALQWSSRSESEIQGLMARCLEERTRMREDQEDAIKEAIDVEEVADLLLWTSARSSAVANMVNADDASSMTAYGSHVVRSDLERVILFDDIEDVVPSLVSEDARSDLLMNFLFLLVNHLDQTSSSTVYVPQHFQSFYPCSSNHPIVQQRLQDLEAIGPWLGLSLSSLQPHNLFHQPSDSLDRTQNFFQPQIKAQTPVSLQDKLSFIRNAIGLIKPKVSVVCLSVLETIEIHIETFYSGEILATQNGSDPKAAATAVKKNIDRCCKKILSNQPNNYAIWNSYAQSLISRSFINEVPFFFCCLSTD